VQTFNWAADEKKNLTELLFNSETRREMVGHINTAGAEENRNLGVLINAVVSAQYRLPVDEVIKLARSLPLQDSSSERPSPLQRRQRGRRSWVAAALTTPANGRR
jgi:hypothetical protein